jgi:hypothetical protein
MFPPVMGFHMFLLNNSLPDQICRLSDDRGRNRKAKGLYCSQSDYHQAYSKRISRYSRDFSYTAAVTQSIRV